MRYFTPFSTCLKSISFHITQEELWDRSAKEALQGHVRRMSLIGSIAIRKDAMLSLTLQSRLGPDTVISKCSV